MCHQYFCIQFEGFLSAYIYAKLIQGILAKFRIHYPILKMIVSLNGVCNMSAPFI